MREVIRGPIGEVRDVRYSRAATQEEIRARLGLYSVETAAASAPAPVAPVEVAGANGSSVENQAQTQQVEA